jgi:hypothetical protein
MITALPRGSLGHLLDHGFECAQLRLEALDVHHQELPGTGVPGRPEGVRGGSFSPLVHSVTMMIGWTQHGLTPTIWRLCVSKSNAVRRQS